MGNLFGNWKSFLELGAGHEQRGIIMVQVGLPPFRKTIRLLLLALVVIAGSAAASWWSAQRLTETFRWVDHTHEVLYELEVTLTHAISIQSGARGFALTGDSQYLTPYDSGVVGIQQSVARLQSLTVDNAQQQTRLAHLSSLVNEEVAVMQERLAARRNGGLTAASKAVSDGRGRQIVATIRSVVQAMQDAERKLLADRSSAARAAGRVALLVQVAAAAVAGLLIAFVIGSIRRLPRAIEAANPA